MSVGLQLLPALFSDWLAPPLNDDRISVETATSAKHWGRVPRNNALRGCVSVSMLSSSHEELRNYGNTRAVAGSQLLRVDPAQT